MIRVYYVIITLSLLLVGAYTDTSLRGSRTLCGWFDPWNCISNPWANPWTSPSTSGTPENTPQEPPQEVPQEVPQQHPQEPPGEPSLGRVDDHGEGEDIDEADPTWSYGGANTSSSTVHEQSDSDVDTADDTWEKI